MKKILAVLISVCLFCACFPCAFAALPDTTPHAAVELLLIPQAYTISDEARRRGFLPEDFTGLGVAQVIPVKQYELKLGDAVPVEEPEAENYRWILIPEDPTHENAEALAGALSGRSVRETLGVSHPFAGSRMATRVVDYKGNEIQAYSTYLIKVWVKLPAREKVPQDLFLREDLSANVEFARLPYYRVFVLFPADAGDFQAAARTLSALYAAGKIACGGVYPTFEISVWDDNSLAKMSHPLAGDPNGDLKITAADARLALREAVSLPTNCPDDLVCDADGDGVVSAADARILLRVAVGLDRAAARIDFTEMSGTAFVGPIPGHGDGGYRMSVSSENGAVKAELISPDVYPPGMVGGTDYHYLILTSKTPGTYKVVLTEQREWESTPLYTREIEVTVRTVNVKE